MAADRAFRLRGSSLPQSRRGLWLLQALANGLLRRAGPTPSRPPRMRRSRLMRSREKEMAGDIVRRARRPTVHCLGDHPLSLGLTKACVRRGDLLITTDSGPRHFAAAFSRPVVTLFGPTHIGWTETYYADAVHLQKKVDCGPCQLRTCPLDHRCMKLLTPQEVFAAAQNLLARRIPQRGAG